MKTNKKGKIIQFVLFAIAGFFTAVSCKKKSLESEHYVVGEDFDEAAFVAGEMDGNNFDLPDYDYYKD